MIIMNKYDIMDLLWINYEYIIVNHGELQPRLYGKFLMIEK